MNDWADKGFLDGLSPEAAAERAELLDHLAARGFSDAELERGHRDGLLPFLPAERIVMDGPPTLSARDVAAAAGIDLDAFAELRRAQGLPIPDPDAVEFSRDEVAGARTAQLFASLGVSERQMLAVLRVLGRGLDQASQVMRATVLEIALEPGLTETELAERYEALVATVMPHIGPMVERMVRSHLRNMVRSEAADASARAEGRLPGEREVAVAFADLVGFTRLGEEVPAEEVGRVAERLEVLAAEVAGGPVRMVKTIGDAAMLVSDDDRALIDRCLALVEAVVAEPEDFPQVRVGIARGDATPRGGDWFGAPVNLASRVCAVARAGSVLVTAGARAAARGDDEGADDGLAWSFAGERRLKGLAAPVKLFRVRRRPR